jgi:hypothetical protein
MSTLSLLKVSDERIEAADDKRKRLRKRHSDLYQQYTENQPKRKAALEARDLLASGRVPPELLEATQRLAAQLPTFTALCNQGFSGWQDAERQIEILELQELDAFTAAAERYVAEVERLVEAELAPALARYFLAWRDAADFYSEFRKATAQAIAARDERRGWLRASDTVRAEAAVPDCPIPLDTLELVKSVLPRPRVFTD